MTTEQLKKYAEKYAKTGNGSWMSEIDWKKYPVKLIDGPGMGSRWFTNSIWIDPESATMSDNMQFNTYIHELRHIWQRKRQGVIIYALKNITQINEPDAVKSGIDAANWFGDEKVREMRETLANRRKTTV